MADPRRRWRYAEQVRAALVARGTPCAPLATTEPELRAQLRAWVALLEFRRPLQVRDAERLVIPERPAPRR